MSSADQLIFVTADTGLLAHWRKALQAPGASHLLLAQDVPAYLAGLTPQLMAMSHAPVVWLDTDSATKPVWADSAWQSLLRLPVRWVAASSAPNDADGIAALDAGCAGFCHAYSDAATLQQVQQVVEMGQVWIGKALMQRLISTANRVAAPVPAQQIAWSEGLTQREVEIAVLAANGASNSLIASQCDISERTVKAHLSAVFSKLNITDRLQLALRVHGIS
jgi:DNA-binding NarL/FixJ family response regulator